LERDYLITLGSDTVTAGTAAAITGKLQQFSQGAVYTTDEEHPEAHGAWVEIHQAKLEALDDILDAANGQPVLVFYWFKHDLARLQARYPDARTLDTNEDIADWNAKKVPLLLAHPASAGHGLNLQDGGNKVVWFSIPWSLELYQQANARLYRQGQQEPCVIVQHLVAEGTVDEDIMAALEGKADCQNGLIEALKARITEAQQQ
jgi:SNF2 family DNA or RNA helicase